MSRACEATLGMGGAGERRVGALLGCCGQDDSPDDQVQTTGQIQHMGSRRTFIRSMTFSSTEEGTLFASPSPAR